MKLCIVIFIITVTDIAKTGHISSSQSFDSIGYSEGNHVALGSSSHHGDYNLRDIELSLVARGSANQAHTAVSSQDAAGHQASYLAKTTLAQVAVQAATTAQTALLAKHALVEFLKKLRDEARVALKAELEQLQLTKDTAEAALKTAQQATKHVNLLTDVLKNAEALAEQAAGAAEHANKELSSQSYMVAAANQRLESIDDKLKVVELEYIKTQEAAKKAFESASVAKNNAAVVGANLSDGNGKHGSSSGSGSIHEAEEIVDKNVFDTN